MKNKFIRKKNTQSTNNSNKISDILNEHNYNDISIKQNNNINFSISVNQKNMKFKLFDYFNGLCCDKEFDNKLKILINDFNLKL